MKVPNTNDVTIETTETATPNDYLDNLILDC